MLGLYGGEDLDVILNAIIFFSKREIWKIHLNNFINIYNAHYKLLILMKLLEKKLELIPSYSE